MQLQVPPPSQFQHKAVGITGAPTMRRARGESAERGAGQRHLRLTPPKTQGQPLPPPLPPEGDESSSGSEGIVKLNVPLAGPGCQRKTMSKKFISVRQVKHSALWQKPSQLGHCTGSQPPPLPPEDENTGEEKGENESAKVPEVLGAGSGVAQRHRSKKTPRVKSTTMQRPPLLPPDNDNDNDDDDDKSSAVNRTDDSSPPPPPPPLLPRNGKAVPRAKSSTQLKPPQFRAPQPPSQFQPQPQPQSQPQPQVVQLQSPRQSPPNFKAPQPPTPKEPVELEPIPEELPPPPPPSPPPEEPEENGGELLPPPPPPPEDDEELPPPPPEDENENEEPPPPPEDEDEELPPPPPEEEEENFNIETVKIVVDDDDEPPPPPPPDDEDI